MYTLPQSLSTKLCALGQRKLVQGEITLLAKAVADILPLSPSETENIALFTLQRRNVVDAIIYTLNDYSYIDDVVRQQVYSLINSFALWRHNVAHAPVNILFTGKHDTVVDDISCLLRYINQSELCAVSDIATNANYIYSMFRGLAEEVSKQTSQA